MCCALCVVLLCGVYCVVRVVYCGLCVVWCVVFVVYCVACSV